MKTRKRQKFPSGEGWREATGWFRAVVLIPLNGGVAAKRTGWFRAVVLIPLNGGVAAKRTGWLNTGM